MADEELKKLKRNELLERLVQLTRENEELKAELVELRAKLADRTLDLLDTGSIAEASCRNHCLIFSSSLMSLRSSRRRNRNSWIS